MFIYNKNTFTPEQFEFFHKTTSNYLFDLCEDFIWTDEYPFLREGCVWYRTIRTFINPTTDYTHCIGIIQKVEEEINKKIKYKTFFYQEKSYFDLNILPTILLKYDYYNLSLKEDMDTFNNFYWLLFNQFVQEYIAVGILQYWWNHTIYWSPYTYIGKKRLLLSYIEGYEDVQDDFTNLVLSLKNKRASQHKEEIDYIMNCTTSV